MTSTSAEETPTTDSDMSTVCQQARKSSRHANIFTEENVTATVAAVAIGMDAIDAGSGYRGYCGPALCLCAGIRRSTHHRTRGRSSPLHVIQHLAGSQPVKW